MPTVSQSATLYVPHFQLIDTSHTGSYHNVISSSQIDFSSDIQNTSFGQSYSVVKVLNVDDLGEIPTKPNRSHRRLALGIGLCVLLIAVAICIPVLLLHFNSQNTSNSSTSSSSTAITTTTTSLLTVCNATCDITSQAALSSYTAAWTFENNLNDILNIYNGTGVNSPGYSTGYIGQALLLTGTQYVTTPFINFAYSSFTIEAWINPTTLSNNGANYTIFGQCDVTGATLANCMRLLLRNSVTFDLYMSFWLDDLAGLSTIASSVAGSWLHVAFVYDYSLRQQKIYRNGYIDGQATLTGSPGAYVGTSGLVHIGADQTMSLFNGLIDQMFVSNRAKTACEILNDASLVAYYSFDSGSVQDSGPNYITGTGTSGVTTVNGHVNQAFFFGSSNAYFYFGDLVALGTANQAFSFSLWANPTSYTSGGTILHVANGANGLTNGAFPWCVPFIGLNSVNSLVAQVWNGYALSVVGSTLPLNAWTHIVQTYSTTNGVILYVNGTQVGTTGSTSYSASGVSDYIFIGYYGTSGSTCAAGSIAPGPFDGAIDELRIYSRELTLSDVCILANQ